MCATIVSLVDREVDGCWMALTERCRRDPWAASRETYTDLQQKKRSKVESVESEERTNSHSIPTSAVLMTHNALSPRSDGFSLLWLASEFDPLTTSLTNFEPKSPTRILPCSLVRPERPRPKPPLAAHDARRVGPPAEVVRVLERLDAPSADERRHLVLFVRLYGGRVGHELVVMIQSGRKPKVGVRVAQKRDRVEARRATHVKMPTETRTGTPKTRLKTSRMIS